MNDKTNNQTGATPQDRFGVESQQAAGQRAGAHVRRMSAGVCNDNTAAKAATRRMQKEPNETSCGNPVEGSLMTMTMNTMWTENLANGADLVIYKTPSAEINSTRKHLVKEIGMKETEMKKNAESKAMNSEIVKVTSQPALEPATKNRCESNTRPRLIAAEPVKNADGTWNVVIQFNAQFASEFLKLTNQVPTPENISAWVMKTMDTEPIKLKKYLLEDEDFQASGYHDEWVASLRG